MKRAVAVIQGSQNQVPIYGLIEFDEIPGQGTRIRGQIRGAAPGEHGLHIHESGDLSRGCESMGPHYNPHNMSHGDRTSRTRHLGDLGNIYFDRFGISRFQFVDPLIRLNGPYSVIGRGLVLHEKRDDHGWGDNEESLKTGNSGGRIACGVIGLRAQD